MKQFFATLSVLCLAVYGCVPHKGEPHNSQTHTSTDGSSGSSQATSDTATDVTTDATDATDSGSNTGATSGGDIGWAIGAYYDSYEVHGEEQTFEIRKYRFFEDGTSQQIRLFCGGETVHQGRWSPIGDTAILLEPLEGEEAVAIPGGAFYPAVEFSQGKTCNTALQTPINANMTKEMPFAYNRGDMCLNCANSGEDQLQWCNGQPPPPCD